MKCRCDALKDIRNIPFYAWVAVCLHVIEGLMSYPIDMNLMSFFHQKFSMDDTTSGKYVSINGFFALLFTLPSGWLIDKIGPRRALLLGFLTGALSRWIIAFSDDRDTIMMALNFGVSIGIALVALSLSITVDRMVEGGSKNIAFGLLYWASNLGDTIASLFNKQMVAFGGVNQFQWVFLITGIASFVGALLTAIWLWPPELPVVEKEKKSIWISLKEVLTCILLYKAMSMAFILIGVRTIFRHMNNILPLYMKRLYGEKVNYGAAIAINPAGVIIFAPIVSILLRNFNNHLSLIFIGTLFSAVAPLSMVIWRPENNEWPVLIFVAIFTIGEVLYSPKVSQLAISLPPEDKKGLFSSLMILPSVVGIVISGEEAGWLLGKYCPRSVTVNYDYWAPDSCANLWLIVVITAITTPIGMLVCYKWFSSELNKPKPQPEIEFSELGE